MAAANLPNTLNGLPLFDPGLVREYRRQFHRDAFPEIERANSLAVPSGRWPASGWVLMRRQDYAQLDPYATDLQLHVCDLIHPTVTLKNLAVVQARCVTTGLTNDADAIYLVQLTDGRGVVYNPWFRQGTTSQYNVRAPAYPGEYYSGSMNGGSAWTWETMLTDLWQQMTPLGAFPGLPAVPGDTPEGWAFVGVSAWEALNAILDYQGWVISVDLTSDTPYGIIVGGSASTAFTTFETRYGPPEDDFAYLDSGSGRAPGSIDVLFHRRNELYGSEETVRRDAFQWQTTPLYSVTVAAPASFTNAAGKHFLWSDFTVRFDIDGSPLPADVATATTIASESAADYYNLVLRSTSGFMRKVFTGALPLGTSGQVDGVKWFQTMKDERVGWRMEVIRGFLWDEVQFSTNAMGLTT